MLAFFSSNHRPLYKESIYRALSYPNGHVIQLRYQEKWLHQDIINNLEYFIRNKVECVLFFYEKNNRSFHSIRKAKIVDYKISDVTKQYHFYIKLDKFIDAGLDIITPQGKTPIDSIYVSNLNVNYNTKNEWFERINELKTEFPDFAFFNINGFYNKSGKKQIKSKFNNYESYYELRDNFDYKIKLSLYNTHQTMEYPSILEI